MWEREADQSIRTNNSADQVAIINEAFKLELERQRLISLTASQK